MAPEIVLKKEYLGSPTDIWATGILLFALLCGQFPFKGTCDKDLYHKIARGMYNAPDHLSHDTRLFLNRILVVEPSKRATATQLLEDPWLKSISMAMVGA